MIEKGKGPRGRGFKSTDCYIQMVATGANLVDYNRGILDLSHRCSCSTGTDSYKIARLREPLDLNSKEMKEGCLA